LKIAFFLGPFPALSETFVLRQIDFLRRQGHELHVFPQDHGTYRQVHDGLLGEDFGNFVHYPPRLAANPGVRLLQAAGWIIKNPELLTRPWRTLLSRASFGSYATSLRLLYWGLPLLQAPRTYDAIVSHFETPANRVAMLKRAGVLEGPMACILHTTFFFNCPHPTPAILRDVDIFKNQTLPEAGLVLPEHGRLKELLLHMGSPAQRTKTLHMGCGTPVSPAPRTAHQPLKLLSVCRLVEKKGLDDALRALAMLKKTDASWVYTILGDGPMRPAWEQLAGQLEIASQVQFLGAANEKQVRFHMAEADIFLAPSKHATSGDCEGIPVSVIEATTAGIPVVGTRHEGIPECVEDDVTGFLVTENDPAALADRISRLLADHAKRAKMSAAAQARGRREFDQQTLNKTLEDLLIKLSQEDRDDQAVTSRGRI